MYEQYLKNAGLTEVQAEIYENLLIQGEAKASEIGKRIKRPRGVVYKGLDELLLLGLVEKIENKAITRFRAEHPSSLEKVLIEKEKKIKNEVEEKRRRLEREKSSVLNNLPDLISAFNLISNKPGVKYFENEEGIKRVLSHIADNFAPDTEIISFVKVFPPESEKEINEALDSFIKKRINKNVKTRVISIDSAEGKILKDNDQKSLRETRLVQSKNLPLDFPGGEIFIYNNEICSIMMEKNTFFAFSIQDKCIAQLLKAFFESEWSLLPSA